MEIKRALAAALIVDSSTTQVTVRQGGYYTLSAKETDRLNLAVAFTMLPEQYKEAILARVVEAEPLEVVASSLGISPRQVQRRVRQGLEMIEEKIK